MSLEDVEEEEEISHSLSSSSVSWDDKDEQNNERDIQYNTLIID